MEVNLPLINRKLRDAGGDDGAEIDGREHCSHNCNIAQTCARRSSGARIVIFPSDGVLMCTLCLYTRVNRSSNRGMLEEPRLIVWSGAAQVKYGIQIKVCSLSGESDEDGGASPDSFFRFFPWFLHGAVSAETAGNASYRSRPLLQRLVGDRQAY